MRLSRGVQAVRTQIPDRTPREAVRPVGRNIFGRDGRGIYLCRGGQGNVGAWIWVGVGDVRALYSAYKERGAIIRQEPTNRHWALEMQIQDPDGNVLRFGSDREER